MKDKIKQKKEEYSTKTKVLIREKFADDGAGWLMLQQILIAPMSLITTVLLAHILSISDYGYYKYVLSIYGIVAIFGFTGFYNISSLNVQRGEDEFFHIGFKYRRLLRWIPAFLSILLSGYYFWQGNTFLSLLILTTIFSHLLVDLYDFYTVGTFGKGAYKTNAYLAIANYFFSFFPPILAAYLTHNLYYVFITMFVCQFLFRIFAFNYVKNKFKFDKNSTKNFSKEKENNFKKESLALSFNNGLGAMNIHASGAIVFNRLGAENTAIYSLAITFADFVYGIVSAPLSKTTLMLSQMTKNNTENSERLLYIKSLYKKYFLISFLGFLFTAISLPFVYKFLFAKYFLSYKYAVLYSISILAVTFLPSLFYFLEKRKLKMINTIQSFSLMLGLIVLFISASKFGLLGAVVVAIFLRFINNIMLTIIYFKKNI